MGTTPVPPRPRLAAHVLPRRHVIDGEERVILHDEDRDEVLQIGPREWGVIEAADGTRDVEGIVVAARRAGSFARVAAVRELLETLAARGLLVAGEEAELSTRSGGGRGDGASASGDGAQAPGVGDGADAGASVEGRGEGVGVAEREASPKPLVPAPGELHCTGAGTCCRLYGTVMMSPTELRRVQALLPAWRVGAVPPERWGMPVRGSEPTPVLATVARDGACGFLRDDGRCEVHRVGGASAKPWGCRAFPRLYVDDGVAVHVTVKPECPCVLEPGRGEAEPMIDPAWTDARSLPPQVVVDALPDAIELGPGRWAPREAVRGWVRWLASRPAPTDAAATAWALADRVRASGLAEPSEAPWEASPPDAAEVMPWVRALHERALVRAREHAAWRSEADLVRRASTALALVTRLLLEPEALGEALAMPPEQPGHEARFWSLGLHAYRWARSGAIESALRDDAVRLWVARSLPLGLSEDDEGDPDVRAPLALVEALLRAHGIGAYVDDLLQKPYSTAP